ncbi:MAG: BatD family protein [Porticoccaceae bacterium]|nr:BatD family protein [Porticoccaceae bacterium]
MKLNLRRLLIILTLCLATMVASDSYAALTAKVDRTVLDSNETLRAELRYDGQVFTGEPDFGPLTKDFEVLSNSRQQNYSNVNGKTESYTAWTLELRPKRAGILLIPSLTFKKEVSNAIELRVRAAPSNSSANPGTQPIYTETTVDANTPYVGQQIILTHRLYTSVQLRDFALSELAIDKAVLHRLGDTQYQKVINGRNYLVLEVKYAIFPQSEGPLIIPSLRFGAYEVNNRSQFGVFNNRGNQIIRDTEPKSLEVAARPPQASIDGWMPSTSVTMEQRWSGDIDSVTVGEPVTRTITIRAEGLSAAQITPLQEPQGNNYRGYPDQPQLDEIVTTNGLTATRIESLALVPNNSGEITLPAVELIWWDTNSNKRRVASLPSITLQVSPSENNDIAANNNNVMEGANDAMTTLASDASKPKVSFMTNLSLALNALLMTLIVTLLIGRKRKALAARSQQAALSSDSARLNLKQQLRAIESEAKDDNLMAMREAVLRWGKTLFAENPPSTLKSLGDLLGNPSISQLFAQLDEQLYQHNGVPATTLDVALLLASLKKESNFSRESASKSKSGKALQSLYPD